MNSTFLECTGKFYEEKGHGPLILFITFGAVFGPLLLDLDLLVKILTGGWFKVLFVTVCVSPILLLGWWHFHREMRYTHCPIRFNRKTRKVHVFRWDGTVMTEDWDNIYFTLGGHGFTEMEVRGHRMAEDGYTVLETFGLPVHDSKDQPTLYSFWEFVRRYMAEGPEKLIGQVEMVMPIADRRESFGHGFMRLFVSLPRGLPFLLFAVVMSFFRHIVMSLAKIPKWPQEVEADCQIEPDDPYVLDAPPQIVPARPPSYNVLNASPKAPDKPSKPPPEYGRASEYD